MTSVARRPSGEALDGLSAEHRSVVVHVVIRGDGIARTAEVLGLPPAEVKRRLYYALASLALLTREAEGRDAISNGRNSLPAGPVATRLGNGRGHRYDEPPSSWR